MVKRPKDWSPEEEKTFRQWYDTKRELVKMITGFSLDPNPDAPQHYYDYRNAYRAGAGPNASGHWPSRFKTEGHPRLIINGINTKTGRPVRKRK